MGNQKQKREIKLGYVITATITQDGQEKRVILTGLNNRYGLSGHDEEAGFSWLIDADSYSVGSFTTQSIYDAAYLRERSLQKGWGLSRDSSETVNVDNIRVRSVTAIIKEHELTAESLKKFEALDTLRSDGKNKYHAGRSFKTGNNPLPLHERFVHKLGRKLGVSFNRSGKHFAADLVLPNVINRVDLPFIIDEGRDEKVLYSATGRSGVGDAVLQEAGDSYLVPFKKALADGFNDLAGAHVYNFDDRLSDLLSQGHKVKVARVEYHMGDAVDKERLSQLISPEKQQAIKILSA